VPPRLRVDHAGHRRWEVRFVDPTDGRRRGQTFDRKGDADDFWLEKRRERQLQRAGRALPRPPDRRTLGEWLDQWMDSPNRVIAPSTRIQRTGMLRRWVRPQLGHVELNQIDRPRLNQWRTQILTVGCGHISANRAQAALSIALSDAVEMGLIGSNPCLGWRKLPEPPSKAHALTVRQVEQIRAHMRDHDRAVLVVMAYIGLRIEELRGLQWRDLNHDRTQLRIRRSYILGAYGPTKTRRDRTLHVPAPVKDDMRPLERTANTDPLLPAADGRPIDMNLWRRAVWNPARIAAGVEATRVQDLRHTAATAMLYAGVPLHDVHRQLGHGSPNTTLNHYAHIQAAPGRGSLVDQIRDARVEVTYELEHRDPQ
jgi:integrase